MSKIEVNTIDVQCGSTLTVGSSGKTVSLATGASQTGFGRTGTVDWCTTAKTSPFTAASGDGFFLNTSCGAITVTLPSSPSAGDIVAFKDYANTWDNNAVTLCNNGSKINGVAQTASLNTESQSVTLIYVDGTKGWQDIHDSTSNVTGIPSFIVATGGTIATCGDFKIHTFTSDGTFTIDTAPTPSNNNVSYMVVAGGAGGGANRSGGGGAGGFREGKTPATPYTASPLVAPAGLPVSVQAYPITVGAGGTAGTFSPLAKGGSGANSVFSTITSAGGGGGGTQNPSFNAGADGGSGGGGGAGNCGGSGNTPPVSPAQGTDGGDAPTPSTPPFNSAAGGGGATAAGQNAQPSVGGAGGAGASTEISGSAVVRAGGGGAGGSGNGPDAGGAGGSGGGGAGGVNPGSGGTIPANKGTPGTANTGGGGGGGGESPAGPANSCSNGGTGGSGIVVIRYKFQ